MQNTAKFQFSDLSEIVKKTTLVNEFMICLYCFNLLDSLTRPHTDIQDEPKDYNFKIQ